jgi:hypothetical protein
MTQLVRVECEVPTSTVEQSFAQICDFPGHALLSDSVRSVTVEELPDGTSVSHWRVNFRKGTLVWSEVDEIDHEAHMLRFRLRDGDPEAFDGSWSVREAPSGVGCVVAFEAEFDVGIPTMRRMLEPIAVRAIQDNISQTLRAVLGEQLELTVSSEDISAASPK